MPRLSEIPPGTRARLLSVGGDRGLRRRLMVVPGPPATGAPASCNGAAAGTIVSTYFAGAAPSNTGFRFFGTNQAGVIYQARVAVPVTQSGSPDWALPIQ